MIENLEGLLAQGQDNALLRYGLGNAYLQQEQHAKAAEHLAKAVEHDPQYSAAWKLYGKALVGAGRAQEAAEAFERGIAVAQARGDVQASKEMTVFLKRLRKGSPQG
ncbi:tetratricopeptide repeat protein [Ectothiorhodospiraceae bacterium 2226]|nr:tetratricopeptide repeat protein [Ectothiorhodospiraceae bacterium 2226]